jgi:hypothetical protein
MVLLVAVLFLIPSTKSSIKHWLDDIGVPVPAPGEMQQHLRALAPATACSLNDYYPLGTDHGVMVVKDGQDRIESTHAAASANGKKARQWLPRCIARTQDHSSLLGPTK